MNRGRLEAFSDGVFAVAITLLALNLTLPGPHHGPLVDQIRDHWPAFVAYLISFFTIGIIWVNHHAVVDNIAVVDRSLLFLNLLLLLFVVLIPFATSTMADYLAVGGKYANVFDAEVSMALYAAVFEAMALSFAAIFGWTLHEGRTRHTIAAEARRVAWLRFGVGNIFYIVAIAVAFFSPLVSLGIIGLTAVYYMFERTPAVRATPDATRQ